MNQFPKILVDEHKFLYQIDQDGIENFFNEGHSLKALSSIEVTDDWIATWVNEGHSLKALLSIEYRDDGIEK